MRSLQHGEAEDLTQADIGAMLQIMRQDAGCSFGWLLVTRVPCPGLWGSTLPPLQSLLSMLHPPSLNPEGDYSILWCIRSHNIRCE